MLFEFDSGVKLTINNNLLCELLKDLRKLGFGLESGGILLGGYDFQRGEYHVTSFTRPGLRDSRGRTYFVRDKTSANRAIRIAWERSGGTVNYLGEWHTHDEVEPMPSEVDKSLMEQIVKDGDCIFSHCFMTIIGSGGGIFCGEVERNGTGQFVGERWSSWRESAS